MKFLVTGSSGFIGTHVATLIAREGHEVCGLDTKPSANRVAWRHEICDLMDANRLNLIFQDFQPEVVIHLAAKTSLKEVAEGDPRYAANTVGTTNLITVASAVRSVRRIIFTSTKYVIRGDKPTSDREYSPTTSYGRSKAEMEELIWKHDGGVSEWCITRPTTIWGPGMSAHYQKFMKMLCNGTYFHIGSRNVKKQMGYVENIAFQFYKLSTAPNEIIHRKVFYLADYDCMVLREWTNELRIALNANEILTIPTWIAVTAARIGDAISKLVYRKFPFTTFRIKNLTLDDVCDIEETRLVCGDLPFTLEDGAKRTAKWFNELYQRTHR